MTDCQAGDFAVSLDACLLFNALRLLLTSERKVNIKTTSLFTISTNKAKWPCREGVARPPPKCAAGDLKLVLRPEAFLPPPRPLYNKNKDIL